MSRLRGSLILLACFLAASHAFGAGQRVKTIGAFVSNGSSNPMAPPSTGNSAYFFATDFDGSFRVWKTNGTTAGTVAVTGALEPTTTQWMLPVGDTLWFNRNDGIHGTELWKTDGTEAGTVMVKDIRPGAASSSPGYFWPGDNGILYFTANDGVHGYELWRTDGTADGTRLVKDITAGTGFIPQPVGQIANGFLFLADDLVHGVELWVTDGTEAGTRMVRDIREGAQSLGWRDLAFAGGVLYLIADDGVHGAELWKSDGTEAGTVLVKDIAPGSADGAFDLVAYGNEVVMSAYDATTSLALWKSDGTEAGTVLVFQTHCTRLVPWGTKIAFFGGGLDSPESGVWTTDGTSAGTQFIVPIEYLWPWGDLVAGSSRLFFGHDGALWTSDGTVAGTKAVRSFTSALILRTVGDVALLGVRDDVTGSEMWRSDGTPEGTYLLRDIADRFDGIGASTQVARRLAGRQRSLPGQRRHARPRAVEE